MLERNSETSKDETVANSNDEKGDENPALSCEEEPSESTNTKNITKRAPGRPKISITGKRGRPCKISHEIANSAQIKKIWMNLIM